MLYLLQGESLEGGSCKGPTIRKTDLSGLGVSQIRSIQLHNSDISGVSGVHENGRTSGGAAGTQASSCSDNGQTTDTNY